MRRELSREWPGEELKIEKPRTENKHPLNYLPAFLRHSLATYLVQCSMVFYQSSQELHHACNNTWKGLCLVSSVTFYVKLHNGYLTSSFSGVRSFTSL